jgi:hypothetical protein
VIREFSAGGLVIRRFHGRPFLAVVRVRDDVVALPKGHPEEAPGRLAYKGERDMAGAAVSKWARGR